MVTRTYMMSALLLIQKSSSGILILASLGFYILDYFVNFIHYEQSTFKYLLIALSLLIEMHLLSTKFQYLPGFASLYPESLILGQIKLLLRL